MHSVAGFDNSESFVAHYDDAGKLVGLVHVSGYGRKFIHCIAVSAPGDLYISVQPTRSNPVYRIGADTVRVAGDAVILLTKFGATDTAADDAPELPEGLVTAGSYPNPLAETATIAYELPVSGPVRLSVFDMVGRERAVLVDGYRSAGRHAAVLEAGSWLAGVYLPRLEAASGVRAGRVSREVTPVPGCDPAPVALHALGQNAVTQAAFIVRYRQMHAAPALLAAPRIHVDVIYSAVSVLQDRFYRIMVRFKQLRAVLGACTYGRSCRLAPFGVPCTYVWLARVQHKGP